MTYYPSHQYKYKALSIWVEFVLGVIVVKLKCRAQINHRVFRTEADFEIQFRMRL